MNINKEKDKQIEMALAQEAMKIEPSKELFSKIRKSIYEQECEDLMKNKGFSLKKSGKLAVAGLLLLSSVTVFGVTTVKSWVGHGQIKYKNFPTEKQILKDVGFVPKYTETLPNGFKYSMGGFGESELIDEAGNRLTQNKDVRLSYTREDDKSPLNLIVTQIDEAFLDNEQSELVGSLDGLDLYYYEQDYKFVPEGYELTKEDQKAQEEGKLEISYGTDEVSIENIQGLSWYDEGLEYMLMGNNYHFTVEEMMEMAEAIIQSNS